MNASKENAIEAIAKLGLLADETPDRQRLANSARWLFIEEFLEAAKRKLPSEKAFANDKKRKKAL